MSGKRKPGTGWWRRIAPPDPAKVVHAGEPRPPEAAPATPSGGPLAHLAAALESGDAEASRTALDACVAVGLCAEAAGVAEAAPDAPPWRRLLAAEARIAADPEDGRAALLALTGDPALGALAHLRLGDLEREQGRPQLALAHYERCLARDISIARARTLAESLRAEGARGGTGLPTLALPRDRLGPAAARYRLLRELGRGGGGTVYLAEDVRLGRRVAIKVLHPHAEGDAERLLAEVQVVAGLAHPGIVRVYDVDLERHLVVMEYLAGGSLRERLLPGTPLPPRAVATLGRALSRILEAVHDRGLVHGDLKPANVLFRPGGPGLGTPVLADFGVARPAGARGRAAGTLAYMAPEVRAGGAAGPRTDLYSLGVILHEALAGAPPFTRPQILSGERLPPPPLPVEVPAPLATLVASLMDPDPERRPEGALDLRRGLAALGPETGKP